MSFSSVMKGMFPFISAAASLGGPLGTLAAGTVGRVLGIDVPATPEGIEAAIGSVKDPEVIGRLQAAEQDFKLQMAKLGFDDVEKIAGIDASDRANARARSMAMKDVYPAWLASTVTVGFFAVVVMFAMHSIEASVREVLDVLLGSLATAFISVINYYFGSSAGSAAKTAIMANGNGK